MSNRRGWWRWGAFVFGVANEAAAIYHVVIGEINQAIIHAGVAAVSLVVWQTMVSRRAEPEPVTAAAPEIDSHIDNLQRAVDAIAVEVERIGEGQRFAQKILEDRRSLEHEPRV